MAKELFTDIANRFYKGVKADAAVGIGISPALFNHYSNGHRTVKEYMVVHIRDLFGNKVKRGGYTDSEILDLLGRDYERNKLKRKINEYKN